MASSASLETSRNLSICLFLGAANYASFDGRPTGSVDDATRFKVLGSEIEEAVKLTKSEHVAIIINDLELLGCRQAVAWAKRYVADRDELKDRVKIIDSLPGDYSGIRDISKEVQSVLNLSERPVIERVALTNPSPSEFEIVVKNNSQTGWIEELAENCETLTMVLDPNCFEKIKHLSDSEGEENLKPLRHQGPIDIPKGFAYKCVEKHRSESVESQYNEKISKRYNFRLAKSNERVLALELRVLTKELFDHIKLSEEQFNETLRPYKGNLVKMTSEEVCNTLQTLYPRLFDLDFRKLRQSVRKLLSDEKTKMETLKSTMEQRKQEIDDYWRYRVGSIVTNAEQNRTCLLGKPLSRQPFLSRPDLKSHLYGTVLPKLGISYESFKSKFPDSKTIMDSTEPFKVVLEQLQEMSKSPSTEKALVKQESA